MPGSSKRSKHQLVSLQYRRGQFGLISRQKAQTKASRYKLSQVFVVLAAQLSFDESFKMKILKQFYSFN